MRKILDAWAVLAWLHDEWPAAGKVQELVEGAEGGATQLSMRMIDVGEVYYRLARKLGSQEAKAFLRELKGIPVKTLPVPKGLVIEAAQLKSQHPISYADAFAVATAIREKAPLVSGDPELQAFSGSGLVEIEWVGP